MTQSSATLKETDGSRRGSDRNANEADGPTDRPVGNALHARDTSFLSRVRVEYTVKNVRNFTENSPNVVIGKDLHVFSRTVFDDTTFGHRLQHNATEIFPVCGTLSQNLP